jgi:hypothetical protein
MHNLLLSVFVLNLQTLAATTPPAQLGQECSASIPCDTGLTCPEISSSNDYSSVASCRPTAYYGEECDKPVAPIYSKICDKGLKCDHSSRSAADLLVGQGGICVKIVTSFKEVGQECSTFIPCEQGLSCFSVSDILQICRLTAYLGEECEKPVQPIYSKVCDTGLVCDHTIKADDVSMGRGGFCVKSGYKLMT